MLLIPFPKRLIPILFFQSAFDHSGVWLSVLLRFKIFRSSCFSSFSVIHSKRQEDSLKIWIVA